MSQNNNNESAEMIQSIGEVLTRYGENASDTRAVEDVAREWLDAGFEDAEEIEDWLRARCFKASDARTLDAAGITPEQAAIQTIDGTASYQDTIAYKLAHNDLSLDEARRIITNHFWNS